MKKGKEIPKHRNSFTITGDSVERYHRLMERLKASGRIKNKTEWLNQAIRLHMDRTEAELNHDSSGNES